MKKIDLMKRIFALFLSLALIFQPYSAEASRRRKVAPKKLSSYILPYKQIVKMSPEDQVKYFMLLHSLVAQIEMRQIFHYTTKKGKTKAFLEFLEQNLKTVAFAEGAAPTGTLLPILRPPAGYTYRSGSTNRFSQYGADTFRITNTAWDSLNDPFRTTRFPQDALITPAAFDIDRTIAEAEPTLPARLQVTPAAASSTASGTQTPQAPTQSPKEEDIFRDGTEGSSETAEAKTAEETPEASKPIYKKEGAGCIFAGYFSKYKLYGDKLFCEPKGLNDPECEGGTKENPKVSCYTFNLKKSDESDFLACTDYKPIADLTVNCNKAFIDAFQKALPDKIESTKYEEWSKKLTEYLNEKQGENGISLNEYCANDNKINLDEQKNVGKQKDECKSINKTKSAIDEILKNYSIETIENGKTYYSKPAAGSGSGKQ